MLRRFKFKEKNTIKVVFTTIFAMIIAMGLIGCNRASKDVSKNEQNEVEQKVDDSNKATEVKVLGKGKNKFDFTVVDKDKNETRFEIHTDKEIVGEALMDLDLIEGDKGQYGIYVKSVNGISADYDKDGVYWAFYVNDTYASKGVEQTKISIGDSYSFRME